MNSFFLMCTATCTYHSYPQVHGFRAIQVYLALLQSIVDLASVAEEHRDFIGYIICYAVRSSVLMGT